MSIIEIQKFNLNKFWEQTPNPLKYILIFGILIALVYLMFSKKIYNSHLLEMNKIAHNIEVTYTLLDNFEKFKTAQSEYNKEIIHYLYNLHYLVNELSANTNKKFDIMLKAHNNDVNIEEKFIILNESFYKISDIYKSSLPGENVIQYRRLNKDSVYKK